jgi:hypothetical protein
LPNLELRINKPRPRRTNTLIIPSPHHAASWLLQREAEKQICLAQIGRVKHHRMHPLILHGEGCDECMRNVPWALLVWRD